MEWQLPKVWVISTIMGKLPVSIGNWLELIEPSSPYFHNLLIGLALAAGTWVTRATMLLHNGGIIQNFGSIQEVLFLEVALTESWVIFITRTSPGKASGGFVMPSWQLVGAVLGVDVLATLFTLFGWIGGPAPVKGE